MIIDQTIDRLISKRMLEQNKLERDNHVSSGKLSASILGQPLQWQILKSIGIPPKDVDEYVLRVFKRGRDIEDWLVGEMPGSIGTQVAVTYRGVVGLIDNLIDSKDYEIPMGVIPHEVKSVKNSKYKRILEQGKPDHSHLLQGALYGLAKASDYFIIDYVAADDLRITSYVCKTMDYKQEIDKIIDNYEKQLSLKRVPTFQAIEVWQKNPLYNNYSDWMDLTDEQIQSKLETEYPEALLKLNTK